MSIDRQAAVWTRLGTQPLRMGQLYLTESECRFTYDPDYLATGLPGVGAIYTPEVYAGDTIVRTRTEAFDFLPPIQALIPPHSEHNFQRRLVTDYLARNGITPASGLEADWEILTVSGHGGIGHLDVFESDEKAVDWYAAPARPELHDVAQESDFSLKDYLTWFDQDAEALMQVIGPTPSVGGAIPKLLVSIPEAGWDGRIGLPSRFGAQGLVDVVLKFEQPAVYPGLAELEALALDVHRAAGFTVPRHWVVEFNGVPALAVERFDRDARKNPLFTESLYSVLASGDARITHNYSYSYDAVGRAIDRSPIDFVSDRDAAKRHLLARLLMALLTGNGDLHLENLSITGMADVLAFSPVYDPTPMRAYSIHNLLSVMPFGGYGEVDEATGEVTGLADAVRGLAKNLGLAPAVLEEMTGKALQVTEDYSERIRALGSLPEANRDNLVAIVEQVRGRLSGM
ncbi:MAG: type II toxin-antitoxin system HipA family toxin [Thiohalobacterales bacterium]